MMCLKRKSNTTQWRRSVVAWIVTVAVSGVVTGVAMLLTTALAPLPHYTSNSADTTAVFTRTYTPLHVASFTTTPYLVDDFSQPTTASVQQKTTSMARYTFVQGKYRIEPLAPQMLVWSIVASDNTGKAKDKGDYVLSNAIAMQVDATVEQPNVAAAIIFHYQDENNFAQFVVANGLYYLAIVTHGEEVPLIEWTPSPAIRVPSTVQHHPAPVTNTLRVETAHGYITLLVNGVRLETIADTTCQHGAMAMAVQTFYAQHTNVLFDNLALYTTLNN